MTVPLARAGAAPRLLRAAVFTAVCVVLSATGHVMAACAAVPWWTLVLGFLGMFAVVAPLAGRPRSTAWTVIALTGGQLALHTLFGLVQRPMVMPAGTNDALVRIAAKLVCGAGASSLSHLDAERIIAASGLSRAGGGVHDHMAMGPGMGSSAMSGMGSGMGVPSFAEGLLPSLPMVLGHLLAALSTGWLLRRGDLALVRLARLSAHGVGELGENARLRALRAALALVQALLAGLPGLPVPVPRVPHASYGPPPAPAGETLQHTLIRRGPPAAFALAA